MFGVCHHCACRTTVVWHMQTGLETWCVSGLMASITPMTGFKHTHMQPSFHKKQQSRSAVYAGARVACTTPWHLLQPTGRGLVKLSACDQVKFWSFAAELLGLPSDVEALSSHFYNINVRLHLKCPHIVSVSSALRFSALINGCFVHHLTLNTKPSRY